MLQELGKHCTICKLSISDINFDLSSQDYLLLHPLLRCLVTVLDVNDNMPVFGCVEYVTSVQENTPGESIARVCDVVCVCGGV